jgi:hypothetical protein
VRVTDAVSPFSRFIPDSSGTGQLCLPGFVGTHPVWLNSQYRGKTFIAVKRIGRDEKYLAA